MTLHSVDQKMVLHRLPVADGAFFDSHGDGHNATCLPNTRVNLLRQIHQWANDPCAKSIFWLKGMAGTGKSTISRTVAQSCAVTGHLGASFFFKRGEADRGNMSKFFTTIAAQLAQREPVIVPSIEAAINADPYIAGKALQDQFDQLIIQPLGNIPPDARRLDTLVLVVDALDECDTETDIKLLINLLSRTKNLQFPKLRILITSRPELPIHLGFTSIKGSYQDLVLHEIPEEIIKDDITAFFKYELARIKTDYNSSVPTNRQLPLNWPEEGNIQLLVKMAIPLFIFAAAVCRFIDDRKCGSPHTQLAQILSHGSSGHSSRLHQAYGPVLSSQLKEVLQKDRDKIINEFTLIVGTIVTLASPLSVLALSQLLNISPDIVDTRLDTLHSVLDVPVERDLPIRLLHLSFRYYLINPEEKKTNELWVDENSAHCNLGKQCLRIMDEGLRENICSMSFPGMRRSTIDSQQIDKCLSPELQYACLYWVHHRTAIDLEQNNMQEVYDFLVEHFLHWLEAMSFMGRTVEGLSILRSLADWLKDREASSLSSFVSDAVRFVKMNFSVIDMTPLQIYSSALVFTPSTSIIRRSFEDPIPTWLSFWPHINEDWDACLSILEGHNNWVRSVVFSHDSRLVASASDDTTVRIWSVETGKCEQVLESHSNWITSVVFSHDSKLAASASGDTTVRIWSVETGKCEQVLEGHSNWITSVVFSHNSKLVASASHDTTVRIWSIEMGKCEQVLEGHGDSVSSLVFSHDSKLVASASHDTTVRIWSVETGKCEQVIRQDHYTQVLSFTTDNIGLVTGNGVIPMARESITSTESLALSPSSVQTLRIEDCTWVLYRGKNIFLLPAECRNGTTAISGDNIAIGCNSGKVVLLPFLSSELERLIDGN